MGKMFIYDPGCCSQQDAILEIAESVLKVMDGDKQ